MYLIKNKMSLIFDDINNNIFLKLSKNNEEEDIIMCNFLRIEINFNLDEIDNFNDFINEEFEINSNISIDNLNSKFENIEISEEQSISFVSDIEVFQEVVLNHLNDEELIEFNNFIEELKKSMVINKKKEDNNE